VQARRVVEVRVRVEVHLRRRRLRNERGAAAAVSPSRCSTGSRPPHTRPPTTRTRKRHAHIRTRGSDACDRRGPTPWPHSTPSPLRGASVNAGQTRSDTHITFGRFGS
jgi:hypothetical protein